MWRFVVCLFLAEPWVGLWSVIVAVSGHNHLFYSTSWVDTTWTKPEELVTVCTNNWASRMQLGASTKGTVRWYINNIFFRCICHPNSYFRWFETSVPLQYYGKVNVEGQWVDQSGASFVDHLYFCVLCFSCFRVCTLLPCGHLLRKGWPLGSCWWYLLYICYFL